MSAVASSTRPSASKRSGAFAATGCATTMPTARCCSPVNPGCSAGWAGGIDQTLAAKNLRKLTKLGYLEVVEKGTNAKRLATTYRYLGPPMLDIPITGDGTAA